MLKLSSSLIHFINQKETRAPFYPFLPPSTTRGSQFGALDTSSYAADQPTTTADHVILLSRKGELSLSGLSGLMNCVAALSSNG